MINQQLTGNAQNGTAKEFPRRKSILGEFTSVLIDTVRSLPSINQGEREFKMFSGNNPFLFERATMVKTIFQCYGPAILNFPQACLSYHNVLKCRVVGGGCCSVLLFLCNQIIQVILQYFIEYEFVACAGNEGIHIDILSLYSIVKVLKYECEGGKVP